MLKILCYFLVLISGFTLTPICQLCHVGAAVVQKSLPLRSIDNVLDEIGTVYCTKKHIEDQTVCKGAVTSMAQYIIASLWKHHTNPHLVCQQMHLCGKQLIKRNITRQIETILKDKPNRTWEQPTKRKQLKIVHISDLHPDLFYSPGAPVDCVEPVCCRSNVSAKANSTKKAGYWGSIGLCDLPLHTFQIFLKQLSEKNPDAIIWTGDNTPHDIWQQSQSYNLNFTALLAQKIRNYTNATVIPAMGNHESWPVNVYAYKSDREESLNGGLANVWKQWLDSKAIQSQRTKGYYSMVHTKLNNLKVISINTQAGNDMNWFLIEDPTDPGQMLKWLESELKQSEGNKQMVYIIGHIPPNDNINEWGKRFTAIVDRYSYIIRGQFYGHTHSDHFAFFPELKQLNKVDDAKLSNYYLVAPSLTTYSDRIPEYRVMSIDYDTLQILDYQQYRLDLRKDYQETDSPSFQLFYKFKQAYQIQDMLVGEGMTVLRNKLRDNPQIQKIYTYQKSAGLRPGQSGKYIICDTMPSRDLTAQCHGETYTNSAFQKAAGPWRDLIHKQ